MEKAIFGGNRIRFESLPSLSWRHFYVAKMMWHRFACQSIGSHQQKYRKWRGNLFQNQWHSAFKKLSGVSVVVPRVSDKGDSWTKMIMAPRSLVWMQYDVYEWIDDWDGGANLSRPSFSFFLPNKRVDQGNRLDFSTILDGVVHPFKRGLNHKFGYSASYKCDNISFLTMKFHLNHIHASLGISSLLGCWMATVVDATGSGTKLGLCQVDCDVDSDCQPGLWCADAHKPALTDAGYDSRKVTCGNVGEWNEEVCFDPKLIQPKGNGGGGTYRRSS